MIVCIAEKPSVARDIAEVVGAKQRKEGYFEGNGYQVTWTFGHFCTLKEPHDYFQQWKAWRLEDLPMIPTNFGIKLIDNSGVKKQFGIIEKLIAAAEEVINCGDAGQEGELIQRWVLLKAKCAVPVRRLWISSLTEQSIREGFSKLKDSEQYNNLYAAGSARAIGDWLLGMNATRLFTKKFGQQRVVLSIGRVQTPTLAMIVQRQKEINAFRAEEYYELKTIYRETEFTATIDRITLAEKAEKGLAYLKQFLFEITSFEKKDAKEGNPRLFDLTGLQVEANKRFGYSAEDTLKYTQNLYERKLITYPRVDTTYLSEDLHPKIEGILRSMSYYQNLTAPVLAKPIPKSKAVFDDKKVTDHHAIIPTEILPQGLSVPEEKRIYDLIARRFIAVFYPECKVANTTVLGKVGEVFFKATGKQILDPGWREVYANDKKDEGEEEEKIMPVFTVGEQGPHEPRVHKGKTTPPKAFTEATLLRAMETAGKHVEDEEVRELLKDNGIGRPSTRANIIETLFKRKYIEKKKKNLFATPTGMDLIDTIQNELLKSPELTGDWERKLRKIEKGEYDPALFKQELIQMVVDLTQEVKTGNYKAIAIATDEPVKTEAAEKKPAKPKAAKESLLPEQLNCPKCKDNLMLKGKSAYGCSQFAVCGFKIPFELFGKKLTEKQVAELIQKGKTGKIKGLKPSMEETPVDSFLKLDDVFSIIIA